MNFNPDIDLNRMLMGVIQDWTCIRIIWTFMEQKFMNSSSILKDYHKYTWTSSTDSFTYLHKQTRHQFQQCLQRQKAFAIYEIWFLNEKLKISYE